GARVARPPGERGPPQRRTRGACPTDGGGVLDPALPVQLAARRLPRPQRSPPRPGRGRAGDRGCPRPRRPAAGDSVVPDSPTRPRRAGPEDVVHAVPRRRAL